MIKKYTKNEQGIAHLLILMLVVMAMVVGGGIGYVMKQNSNERARQQNAEKLAIAAKAALLASEDKDESQAVAVPAEQQKAVVAEPKPVSKPTTSTKKTSPPPEGTVTISDDGCNVTVVGKAGMKVKIGAYNDNKGGESEYTIPDNGTLIERSGGIKEMFAYGKLYNSAGEKVAYASKTITAENCF